VLLIRDYNKDPVSYYIETGDSLPIRQRGYRLLQDDRAEVNRQIKELEECGIIKMVRQNRDVDGSGCVKDVERKNCSWKAYYYKLSKASLFDTRTVCRMWVE